MAIDLGLGWEKGNKRINSGKYFGDKFMPRGLASLSSRRGSRTAEATHPGCQHISGKYSQPGSQPGGELGFTTGVMKAPELLLTFTAC